MDQVEPLSVLIGAALGSAGLSGALAGLVQFSRAARAARLIEHVRKSLDGFGSGPGEQALRLALDRERLRLASIAIITTPQIVVFGVVLLVVAGAIAIGVNSSGLLDQAMSSRIPQDRDGDGVAGEIGVGLPTWRSVLLLMGVFLAYILFFAFVMDQVIQLRRARFMEIAGESEVDMSDLVRVAGSHTKRLPQRDENAVRRRPR